MFNGCSSSCSTSHVSACSRDASCLKASDRHDMYNDGNLYVGDGHADEGHANEDADLADDTRGRKKELETDKRPD